LHHLLIIALPINPWLKSPIFMVENTALHKNGIEIYQKVNGGISFHLPVQENSVRRRTMLYDVKQFF
jgi:hypothetical protein